MLDFFASPQILPFTVSLGVMFGLFLIELLTLLIGGNPIDALIPDFETSIDMDVDGGVDIASNSLNAFGFSYLLGWLHFGRVPVMLIIALFLAGFGVGGMIMQHMLDVSFGSTLPTFIAVIIALIPGIFSVRYLGGILSRILPRDESSAVSTKQFIGQVATITSGNATENLSAEASLTDAHGLTHYFLVRPSKGEGPIQQGEQVLILSRKEAFFIVVRSREVNNQ